MANSPTLCVSEVFQGLNTQRVVTAFGDELRVARQGAHVLSWVSKGRERLFLSPRNAFDGHTAIRGGVPVCFPQFNQRGSLPKHGFARNVEWQLKNLQTNAQQAQLTFGLNSSDITRQWWPQSFEARLNVSMTLGELQVTLHVNNTDTQPLHFSGALHTYLAVDALEQTTLTGLQGRQEWDAVTDTHAKANDELRFDAEFDRVYDAPASIPVMVLRDGSSALEITQSASWGQSVVWNPGAEKGAALADMPEQGYRHMLCVEAAQVYQPIEVAAGQSWEGWQRLRVLEHA